MNYKRFMEYYKATALMLLNVCLLFLLLNAGLFVIFQIYDRAFKEKKTNPVSKKYGNPSLKKVYPQLSEKAINDLLGETWSRPFIYEAYTQFRERPFEGKYVNVDKHGFRRVKNQGHWPPDPNFFNIFLFGGSTTFGYGVADEKTIASFLQQFLSNNLRHNLKVYNFGRGNYYSTQERILFEKLLISNFIPDMAIFIDGLNDFYFNDDNPVFTYQLQQFFDNPEPVRKVYFESKIIESLPMTRAARSLKYRIINLMTKEHHNIIKDKEAEVSLDEDKYNDEVILVRVIDRYLKNKELIEKIASVYGLRTVFVWQPIPFYKYNLNYHLFKDNTVKQHTYSKYGYPYMAKLIKRKPLGDNFFYCSDMQEHLQEPLYVDSVHYSAKMSELLAVKIGDLLLERNFLIK